VRPQTSTDLNQHSQGNQVCHRKTSSLNVTRDARALYCRTAHLHLFVYITITFMMSRNALRHCHVTSQLHGFLEPIRTERRIILQGSIDPQCRWDCAHGTHGLDNAFLFATLTDVLPTHVLNVYTTPLQRSV